MDRAYKEKVFEVIKDHNHETVIITGATLSRFSDTEVVITTDVLIRLDDYDWVANEHYLVNKNGSVARLLSWNGASVESLKQSLAAAIGGTEPVTDERVVRVCLKVAAREFPQLALLS